MLLYDSHINTTSNIESPLRAITTLHNCFESIVVNLGHSLPRLPHYVCQFILLNLSSMAMEVAYFPQNQQPTHTPLLDTASKH